MTTISSPTPGQVLTALTAVASVSLEGARLRITSAAPLPDRLVEDARDRKPEIVAMLTLEARLVKGLGILRAMESSGQMGTGKYAQRLQKWERLDQEYRDLHDGLVRAGIAA